MIFTQAFWSIIHKFFKWRPICIGCCDCKETYYLTQNRIVNKMVDKNKTGYMVITCPSCGLLHAVVFVRFDKGLKKIKVESIY